MIETWCVRKDVKDIEGITLMMMITMGRMSTRWRTTTRTTTTTRMTTMIRVSQLWDWIETCGFHEDIKDSKGMNLMMMITRRRITTRWRTTTRTTTTTRIKTRLRLSQFWD